MRKIEDLEHFVLAEGETLILRPVRMLSMEAMQQIREAVERYLPGRPVIVLTPELEVLAGRLEIMGAEEPKPIEPTAEEILAWRKTVESAYNNGKQIYFRNIGYDHEEWLFAHLHASPHDFDWLSYEYSLVRPPATPTR